MNMVIKVSDFGLSVNTGNKEYYRLSGDMGIKLPFRWMAPETFSDYIFSEKSDIVRNTIRLVLIYAHNNSNMIVELWSNILGDFHWRPSPLYRH